MTPPLPLVLVEPPARTSHEIDLWSAIPDSHLTVVSDRDGWPAADVKVFPTLRLPYLGDYERWTLALAWLRGLRHAQFGPVAAVASLELFSVSTFQAARLARRLNALHVIQVCETMANNPCYRAPPYRSITKRVGVHADIFVCTTERSRQHAVARGCDPDRTAVIPYGVDTTVFAPAPQLVRDPVVVFVGALRADGGVNKGLFDVIDACARAREQLPALRLIVAGDGPQRDDLLARCRTAPWIDYRGQIDRTALPDVLREGRCFALGSRSTWKWEEQFGFVLVEAMAAGLPIVTTASGAIPEIVPDWNHLVAEGASPKMAAALVASLGPAAEALGQRNREYAARHFDRHGQGRRLGDTLRRAIGRR